MDATTVTARLDAVSATDSRELDRVCEQVAEDLMREGSTPPFTLDSADFAADPRLICADRYWRLRFLELPTVRTAAACSSWLVEHAPREYRTEILEKWSLGYAFITKDSVESGRELSRATEDIVSDDSASGDAAYFATLYHAGKLRSNFWSDELHQFLDSSLLALAAGVHRRNPLFVALRSFAAFGSPVITAEHAVGLLDEAWDSPERTRHVVDICLNGIQFAVPFDGYGELLRSRAEQAVREYPGDHIFEYRLASGQHMCRENDAALVTITAALRHLPALGSRGSHKLLQEQYLSKRDEILQGRMRAEFDAAYELRAQEREAEHRRKWQELETQLRRGAERQDRANAELQETSRAAAVRAVELVAVFTATIAFAMGSLQVSLQGSLTLRDRLWIIAGLGGGLALFALLVVGGTWLITRRRT
ncbi:hypothetical protein DY218_11840 [Streptomyces triticagri]|uniref:Uncharacterized protein n=1 Tax=Streptomyces triticagri TaxID=2293568 RepID=A0A372M6X9_9ACTN|nr:hypothetical protein [Streptomyces triticagri]RFU86599.1 hypothetical protein DY218_11840 [Streptomyces triticagri]